MGGGAGVSINGRFRVATEKCARACLVHLSLLINTPN